MKRVRVDTWRESSKFLDSRVIPTIVRSRSVELLGENNVYESASVTGATAALTECKSLSVSL